jgi:hypothetical protein
LDQSTLWWIRHDRITLSHGQRGKSDGGVSDDASGVQGHLEEI